MAESHPIENWRPVVGYEGAYEVSDLGNVRSLPRMDSGGRNALKGHTIKAHVRRGYAKVGLGDRWHRVCRSVHRLVLEAFVGPCPPGMEACHNNGVRNDNRVTNLRWDTRSANHADKLLHGTSMRRERHFRFRLTDDVVGHVRFMRGAGAKIDDIVAAVGISRTSVKRAIRWGGPGA